jgi:hypothetical protein
MLVAAPGRPFAINFVGLGVQIFLSKTLERARGTEQLKRLNAHALETDQTMGRIGR